MKRNKYEREQWVADLRQRQSNILFEDRMRNAFSLPEDDNVRPIKTWRQLIGLIMGFLVIVAVVAISVGAFPIWSLVLIVTAMFAALCLLGLTFARSHKQRRGNVPSPSPPRKDD